MAKGRKYGSLTQKELKNVRHANYASLLKQGLVIGRKIGGGGRGEGGVGREGYQGVLWKAAVEWPYIRKHGSLNQILPKKRGQKMGLKNKFFHLLFLRLTLQNTSSNMI